VFDLADVRFIKRIVIGSDNPERMKTEAEINQAISLLNRCLTDSPKGHIIGAEKNFALLNVGEHQVVLQYVVYHIGFSRKPYWLD
jgi:hypothetical protein